MKNPFASIASVLAPALRWRRRPVPVVLQMNATECAAACLTMVLRFHGLKVSLDECRGQLGTGRDGASARAIAEAARSHGLRVRAFSADIEHLRDVRMPAIAFWGFNHFVVVERRVGRNFEIVDPGFGRRTVSADEFSRQFTGVVLAFEPGIHFRPGHTRYAPWYAQLRHLVAIPGLPSLFLQVLLASLLLPLIGLALPLLTKVVVDRVLALQLVSVMKIIGLGIVTVTVSQWIAGYLRSVLLIYLHGRLDTQLMVGLQEHLLHLPLRFFQQRTSGDLLMRMGSGARIRELLTNQSLSLFLDGTLVAVYLVVLLGRAPLFGLVACTIGLLQVLLLVGTSRRVHALTQQQLVAQAATQSFGIQVLEGITTLKASGSEGVVLDYWSNLFYRELNVSLRREHLAAFVQSTLSALRTFAPLVLLWLGAFLVLDGRLQLGSMLAYSSIALAFLSPLASLVSTGQQLQMAGAHLQRMADLIETAPEQGVSPPAFTPELTGRIELRGLGFRYNPGSPEVLSGIDLVIEPGQKVALVGRTGSGKSTLALLLLGLYEPTEGQVLYDGIPLSQLNFRMLRSQFGVVLQHPLLFSGTVRDNVALNNPSIPFERVVEACRLAALDADIRAMPMQYETWIGEGGGSLSGGQRQRLALARALAHSPPLLLLDEATSHLDVATEAEVERNLGELRCTRVVIAHRLSTIRNADLILVVDGGRIVERGTHEQLLAQGGRYTTLVQSQLGQESVTDLFERAAPV